MATSSDRRSSSKKSKSSSRTAKREPAPPRAESTLASEAARQTGRAQRDRDPELEELPDEALVQLSDAFEPDPLTTYGTPEGATTPRADRRGFDPEVAAGDPDAAETGDGSSEEGVGDDDPTPEQNDVDRIGDALGVSYQPDEPLHTTEKIAKRDENRWELNPASSEDFAERRNEQHAMPERAPRRRR